MLQVRRVWLVLTTMVIWISMLPAPVMWAQVPSPMREYKDVECGFGFNYAPQWVVETLPNRLAYLRAPRNVIQGLIGWVQDVSAGQQSTEAEALAAAGGYCLDCLRQEGKLIWIDRIVHRSMIVSYVLFRETLRRFWNNNELEEEPGFSFTFWIFENGTARRLASGSQTRAKSYFWVHQPEIATAERTVLDTIRSLQFARATQACW